jgi:hypothetical protein
MYMYVNGISAWLFIMTFRLCCWNFVVTMFVSIQSLKYDERSFLIIREGFQPDFVKVGLFLVVAGGS